MLQETKPINRKPTPWESVMTIVIDSLIQSLPAIIRDGNHSTGITIAPYKNVPLPDLDNFDTKQQLALCPILSLPVATTRLSLRNNQLNGLDSVASYGPITFPVQDIELSIPLVFKTIQLNGDWETLTQCQKGDAAAIDTAQRGTYRASLIDVQVTVGVKLNQSASSVTGTTITLTDYNRKWMEQPTFNAETGVTFDDSVSLGQKTILTTMLNDDVLVRPQFRKLAKDVIESTKLAESLRQIINKILTDTFS